MTYVTNDFSFFSHLSVYSFNLVFGTFILELSVKSVLTFCNPINNVSIKNVSVAYFY